MFGVHDYAQNPVSCKIQPLFITQLSDHLNDPRVAETKARLEKVKDEFERYKLKAEAVLKAKVSFRTTGSKTSSF